MSAISSCLLRVARLLACVVLAAVPGASVSAARNGGMGQGISLEPADSSSGALAAYGQLPLSFEANQGQADPSVDFLAHGHGYSLALNSAQDLEVIARLSGHRA